MATFKMFRKIGLTMEAPRISGHVSLFLSLYWELHILPPSPSHPNPIKLCFIRSLTRQLPFILTVAAADSLSLSRYLTSQSILSEGCFGNMRVCRKHAPLVSDWTLQCLHEILQEKVTFAQPIQT